MEVIAGWDGPLERLFLVVNRIEKDDSGEWKDTDTLFSNLDWEGGPDMSLWEIASVLAFMGPTYPPEWLRAVANDQRARTRNEETDFGPHFSGHHPPFQIDPSNHNP